MIVDGDAVEARGAVAAYRARACAASSREAMIAFALRQPGELRRFFGCERVHALDANSADAEGVAFGDLDGAHGGVVWRP